MKNKLSIIGVLAGLALSSCGLIQPPSTSEVTSQPTSQETTTASQATSETSSIESSETTSSSSEQTTTEVPQQDFSANIYEISSEYPLGKLIKSISFNKTNKAEKLQYIKDQLPQDDNYFHYEWNQEFPEELPSSDVSYYYSKTQILYHVEVVVHAYDSTPVAYTITDDDLPYGEKTGFDYDIDEEAGYIFMGFYEGDDCIDDMGSPTKLYYPVTHDVTITAYFLKVMFTSSTLDISYIYEYNEHRIRVLMQVKEEYQGLMRVPYGEELDVPCLNYYDEDENNASFEFDTEGFDPKNKVLNGNIEAFPLD